jgi:hypothetical protein
VDKQTQAGEGQEAEDAARTGFGAIRLSVFETGPIGHSGTSPKVAASDYRNRRSPREAGFPVLPGPLRRNARNEPKLAIGGHAETRS